MKTFKLTTGEEVTLRTDPLTWRERETLRYQTFGSFNSDKSINVEGMINAQMNALKLMITKIEKDAVVTTCSDEWINKLSQVDGDKLFELINEIHAENDKKKAELPVTKS